MGKGIIKLWRYRVKFYFELKRDLNLTYKPAFWLARKSFPVTAYKHLHRPRSEDEDNER